jgi:hypothetical protein
MMAMPYRTDPRMAGRHPFEIFSLILGLLTGLPRVLGVAPAPNSITAALPPFIVTTWSAVLVAGCAIAIFGIWWHERALGLILEQLGLAMVGVACVVYSGVALASVGISASIPAGIIFAFGASCLVRWRQIQRTIDEVSGEEKRRHRRRS